MKRYIILLLLLSFLLAGCLTVVPGPTQDDTKPVKPTAEVTPTGWVKEGGNTYYLREDGSRHIGWLDLDGKRYYTDNYEDAIVISEKVVREDIFTSVHVSEYALEVRETKRGLEELTSDIPNVSDEATKDLDENGIIRVGAYVEPGSIMVGKITPKGESDPSPEEKLLRAIFGDKAGDVKDASLKATPSLSGVVIDTSLYSKVIKDRKEKQNNN